MLCTLYYGTKRGSFWNSFEFIENIQTRYILGIGKWLKFMFMDIYQNEKQETFCDNFLETFCFKKFQAFMLL